MIEVKNDQSVVAEKDLFDSEVQVGLGGERSRPVGAQRGLAVPKYAPKARRCFAR